MTPIPRPAGLPPERQSGRRIPTWGPPRFSNERHRTPPPRIVIKPPPVHIPTPPPPVPPEFRYGLVATFGASARPILHITNIETTMVSTFSAHSVILSDIETVTTTENLASTFSAAIVVGSSLESSGGDVVTTFVAGMDLGAAIETIANTENLLSSFSAGAVLGSSLETPDESLLSSFSAGATLASSLATGGGASTSTFLTAAGLSVLIETLVDTEHLTSTFSAHAGLASTIKVVVGSENLLSTFSTHAALTTPGVVLTAGLTAAFSVSNSTFKFQIAGNRLTATFSTSEFFYPSGKAPNAVPPGMKVAFFDDFLSSTLNSAIWSATENTSTGKLAASHVVTPGDSTLRLQMYYDATNGVSASNYWVGGGVGSWNYGKVPVGSAVYVCLKTNISDYVSVLASLYAATGWPPEIDFCNITPATTVPTTFNALAHYGSANSQISNTTSGSTDFTQWHVYGCEWGASSISYSIDGVIWATATNPDSGSPNGDVYGLNGPTGMVVTLQIETGDPSTPAENTSITSSNPIQEEIDWVQVFVPTSGYAIPTLEWGSSWL